MAYIIQPFLMFNGQAEEAVNHYISVFDDAEMVEIDRYDNSDKALEGMVRRLRFRLGDQYFMAIDSPVKHEFGFTPAFSIFIECEDAIEIQHLFECLGVQGKCLMPLDGYGFSRLFAWLNDRFGVSWQLNLQ